jgi:hypothetical protein
MSDIAQTKRRALLMEGALLDLTKVDWSQLDLTECIHEREKVTARGKRNKKPAPKVEGTGGEASDDS